MATIEEFTELQKRAQGLNLKIAKAELVKAAAEAKYDEALELLKTKFKVTSVEDAKAKLKTLTAKADKMSSALDKELSKLENSDA